MYTFWSNFAPSDVNSLRWRTEAVSLGSQGTGHSQEAGGGVEAGGVAAPALARLLDHVDGVRLEGQAHVHLDYTTRAGGGIPTLPNSVKLQLNPHHGNRNMYIHILSMLTETCVSLAVSQDPPEQDGTALGAHGQVYQLVSVHVQTGAHAAAKVLKCRGDVYPCDALQRERPDRYRPLITRCN